MTEHFCRARAAVACLAVACSAAAGCAGAPRDYPHPEEPSGEVGESADAMAAEIASLERELAIKLGLGAQGLATGSADCPAAVSLRDRICDLSERICHIAEQNPADGPTAHKCDSARDSCTQARIDVAQACPQASPP